MPLAAEADHAKVATRANFADSVARVERADRATQADRADSAGVADALAAVDTNVESVEVAEGSFEIVEVECDAGLVPVGGGSAQTGDFGDFLLLSDSAPITSGWLVTVFDGGSNTGQPTPADVYAICIDADAT